MWAWLGVVTQEVLSGVGEGLPGGASHGCWQKAWVPCLAGLRAACGSLTTWCLLARGG